MYKQEPKPHADYITIVYTYAHKLGFPIGRVLYRSMNGCPYHPALGICQWGEGWQNEFYPGGSRVSFSDLPEDCQKIILNDYKYLWDI
jgi:hypothetical protein